MKILPALLLPALLSAAASATEPPKDPAFLAEDCARRAAAFLEEAKAFEHKAAQAVGAEAEKIKHYAGLTRNEAEALAKASKAWANRQIRLAEKHMAKAREFCEQRAKLAPFVHTPHPNPEKDETACKPAENMDSASGLKPHPEPKKSPGPDAKPDKDE